MRLVLAAACVLAIATAAAAAPPATKLDLAPTHLGPIKADTKVDVAGLQKLLPDLKVEDASYDAEDGPHSAVKISRGDAALFTIEHEDGKLGAVQIVSPDITSDTGLVVGQPFDQAIKALGKGAACYGMVEEEGGSALCHAPGTSWIYAVIVPMHDDKATYYDKKVPPKKWKTVFAGQTVERVIWSPAAPK